MVTGLAKLGLWWSDEGGLETAEWIVLLGAVIVPVAYFILQIAHSIARFYEITSWLTTLPFP